MTTSIEIDFLAVETSKSGDAITIRYPDTTTGEYQVHVVDGGYLETGERIVEHIKTKYSTHRVDHVVLTHPDGDHANGLRVVLEHCEIGELRMNRPWLYADELITRFSTYTSVDHLRRKLRSIYSASAKLEDLAIEKGIPIREAFQGDKIGIFTVLAPTRERYLDLVAESEKTPEAESPERTIAEVAGDALKTIVRAAKNLIKAAWGEEYFPPSGTSCENEMSLIQYAEVKSKRILLTGDTGRDGLTEAADFAPEIGLNLPGIHLFQVPHHGGRHNVSTETLDRWLGGILPSLPDITTWSAVCSSAKADEDHPRNSVKRAMIHRGAHFSETEGKNLFWNIGAPRQGYNSIPQAEYPSEQEN